MTTALHPCYGRSWLFDSINPMDHAEAKTYCATCPAIEWCKSEVNRIRTTGDALQRCSLEGTWAGELYGAPPGAVRIAKEEAQFDYAEARACHSAFVGGDRTTPRVLAGQRVYDRRLRRDKQGTKIA